MVQCSKAIGKIASFCVENVSSPTDRSTKENGMKVNLKVLVLKSGPMEEDTKAAGTRANQ